MSCDRLTRLTRIRHGNFRIVSGRQFKQMLLAFRFGKPLPSPAVNPTLVPGEFFEFDRVFLLQLGIRVSRLVQDAIQRVDFLLRLSYLLLRLSYLLL